MRKVEQQMIAAIRASAYRTQTFGNTTVDSHGAFIRVYLHGNLIAEFPKGQRIMRLTLAGWNTPTTRSRLNALLTAFASASARIASRKGTPMYRQAGVNGDRWESFATHEWLAVPMIA